ncbi:MAG TPA: hypothetical protein VN375_19090 [Vicinamibacteria bacterium]|jgi:hypothetical protein|nr:hypothetical protein [Vicinamibacteria bacterium]
MGENLKADRLTLHPSADQLAKWRRATREEGFHSVRTWAAFAIDAYVNARAGEPLPLAWRRGTVNVDLPDGSAVDTRGWQADPYAIFRGDGSGPAALDKKTFSLLYLPNRQLLVTFHSLKHCQEMAAIIEKGRKV